MRTTAGIALGNRYQPAVAPAERFLTAQGRNKFVSPLFRTLYRQGEWGQPIATRLYQRTRPTYHSVTQNAVDRALRGES